MPRDGSWNAKYRTASLIMGTTGKRAGGQAGSGQRAGTEAGKESQAKRVRQYVVVLYSLYSTVVPYGGSDTHTKVVVGHTHTRSR